MQTHQTRTVLRKEVTSTVRVQQSAAASTHSTMDEKRMKRTFYVIFISLVIDLLAFTVILPLLPTLLDHYGHNDRVMFIFSPLSLHPHNTHTHTHTLQ